MKALRLIWAVLRMAGLAALELLTLAAPKADDAANGVCIGGQGR